jgi:hypothetical protein
MSPAPAADGAIFVSLAPPECEHDPTILLFLLTCSMAYSVLTRAFLGVWCDQAAVRVTPISKFASPRTGQRLASKWGARQRGRRRLVERWWRVEKNGRRK